MPLPTLLALLSLTAAARPITLDEALALAAKRNADLEIARADRDEAAVEVTASYAGVLPRLDLTGSFGHQFEGSLNQVTTITNPTPPPDVVRDAVTVPPNDFGAYSVGIGFAWPLFDGLASWNRIDAAKARSGAAKRSYDETALRTAFEVTRRFYDLVKQERALEVRRETAALSQDLVKRADALFAAGRGTKADTYSARANLGNDQLGVSSQGQEVVRARSDLAVVLGLTSDGGLEATPPPPVAGYKVPPEEPLAPLADLLAQARKARPLLASGRLSREAADLEIARAQGAYWPTVGLNASWQKQGPELTGTNGLFGDIAQQYVANVGVTIGLNLFAGGETRAGVQRAVAQAHRAQAQLEQGQEIVSSEVTVARERVATISGQVETVRQILDASEQALRASRERLEAGVGSQLEVRDAALKLEQARLSWVNTVVDLVVARADLNRAVGGSL